MNAPALAHSGFRVRPLDAVLSAGALLFCVLVKIHYRYASPEELRWLLGPTAWLTGLLTRHSFEFEAGFGYVNRELGLVIAPVCAGANYFVVALGALVLGFAPRLPVARAKVSWAFLSPGIAYAATLATNSLRIACSVLCRPFLRELSAAQRAEWHRAEGVVVFLTSLLLLWSATHALHFGARRAAAKRLWLPVAFYLAVTLVTPLLLGAAARPQFATHALVVLAVGAALLAVIAIFRSLKYTARA